MGDVGELNLRWNPRPRCGHFMSVTSPAAAEDPSPQPLRSVNSLGVRSRPPDTTAATHDELHIEPVDEALWRAVVTQNDAAAFGEIYDRHCDSIHRYLARRLDSRELTEDLLSTVFLEAWRCRARASLENGSPLPWLFGIARMTLRRNARTAGRARRALARLAAEHVQADHADGVAEALDRATDAKRVLVAFRRLRKIDQDVIELCLWQGFDYESASVSLGVPVGTVKSRLSRARARLQKLLDEEATRES
jgi:RNA polymerase sigma-70 factor (ECF subfamily)